MTERTRVVVSKNQTCLKWLNFLPSVWLSDSGELNAVKRGMLALSKDTCRRLR